jgi:hypothetical protein
MNCQDVREQSSAPPRGGTGLTEQALVHAHVAQCADCQAERVSLQLVASSRPPVELSREAVTAHLIGQVRPVITRVAPSLLWLRSSSRSAFQGAARAAREATGAEATRILGFLTRLGVLVSSSLTVSGRAIAAVSALLALVVRRLPTLFVPSARAAAGLIGRARSGSARLPRLLIPLGSAVMIAGHGAARAASVAAGAVLGLVSRSFGETIGAAGRGLTASRVGAMRTRDVIFRVGGRVPALLAPSARAVGHIVGTIPAGARAHPRICAGIASVAVLVAAILFLGPRQWPDNLVPRLSPGERLLRDVRLPLDRKPVEPIAATPLVQVTPPRPAPGPQPVPPPRVVAPETYAAIPAPARRAPAPAPLPSTEAAPNADASDPAAAIDWLLKGSGRRHAESP